MIKSPISLQQVRIADEFWSKYDELVRRTVIPYQWEALNDRIPGAEPSYAIRNFRIAAGLEEGEFGGLVFQDSDLAKWLEAVGYSLSSHPDPELERLADEVIDIIVKAQHEDGYINTYFTIKEPGRRWTNLLDCHELYCAGHLMEAAVAYYEATGKRKLLDAVCRYADYIDTVFGPEPDKLQGYDGHQEIELALVKLYKATGNEKYLRLSRYFIDQRGREPHFFIQEWERRGHIGHWRREPTGKPDLKYNQSHLPVREQDVAVGHAVRAVYMYSAMADLALLDGDEGLAEACRRLWGNIAEKQMYITGGIGSTHHGEAFSFDYDLPNDTVYAETCASIGLIFFAHRMLLLESRSEYADVLERALYNNVIGSMSQDGKHYFYVNPLEVWPEASRHNPGRRHVKPVRQPWFGCSCCPPNVARLISSLGQYIYTAKDDTIYAHLYIGSEATIGLSSGNVQLTQQSSLPWDGAVKLTVCPERDQRFTLALRLPGWCGEAKLAVNGKPADYSMEHGYARIERVWSPGDTVEWELSMEPQLIEAHPYVRANAGKAAIQRGPLVYCLEEADHEAPLSSIALSSAPVFRLRRDPGLPGNPVVIESEGSSDAAAADPRLYRPSVKRSKPVHVKAIPYFLWGNRTPGEMSVWIRS